MPQPLYFSELEEPAPANIKCQTPMSWFNHYGGFLIETKWNPKKRGYETIYHKYNYPNTDLMPTE